MKFHYITMLLVVLAIGCSDSTPPQDGDASPSTSNQKMTGTADTHASTDSSTMQSDFVANAADDSIDVSAATMKIEAIMRDKRYEEGYAEARELMKQLVDAKTGLPWFILESIPVGEKRIDVHLNKEADDRSYPDDGIVRPLSFRVWDGDDLLQTLDFEVGRFGGDSMTAAIGETTGEGHSNYGILDVNARYKTIRDRVVELVSDK